jgi:hypothetical protein
LALSSLALRSRKRPSTSLGHRLRVTNTTNSLGRLSGRVCSGRGLGAAHIATLKALGERHFSAPLFPGTLNVILAKPVHLVLTKRVETHGAEGPSFWPVQINGIPALAHRFSGCPLHIVEILSNHCLRESMSLRNRDVVELEFEPGIAEPGTNLQRFCWVLVWKGREKSFYRDSYACFFRGLILRALLAAAAQRLSGPRLSWSVGLRKFGRRVLRLSSS